MIHPIYELIKSIFKLSVSCIKITIECRKFVPDLSSDPFHKLLESVLKLCTCYIKKTIENKKLASYVSAATKKKDVTLILSSEETKNPFPQLPVPLLEKIIESLTSGRKSTHANILEQLIT
ncbi:hypothetical protein DAPPUDRAFT_342659 [Daphnia pulex]|uniref:Uncharacterized protein n=1 Tax=Daphnia pulex TaxID=6669 RepID=E9I616_DAPPU|nr:hypothetical protein DAPPUDRAFT_342659 [Daphnia pulex]|eukprot:EFX60564.1 hypothetical protein DAPPUDRAFT_342659 [Daphnia pulex]